MVNGSEREIRTTHLAARLSQTVKGLRRRDLVNEVQIDVEQRRLALRLTHDVRLPEFV
jgi:hypothetical protein